MLDDGRVPWIRPPETGMPDSDVLRMGHRITWPMDQRDAHLPARTTSTGSCRQWSWTLMTAKFIADFKALP